MYLEFLMETLTKLTIIRTILIFFYLMPFNFSGYLRSTQTKYYVTACCWNHGL